MSGMKRMIAAFAVVSLAITLSACGSDAMDNTEARMASAAQTMCPVMGGKVNKSLYADHEGKRIYVCCPGCVNTVKEDPQKYIDQLEAKGITLDTAPSR